MARSTPRVLPFAGGMVPDLPSHLVGPDRCVYAENMFAPNGVFRRRYGFRYFGSQSAPYNTYGAVLRTASGKIVMTSAQDLAGANERIRVHADENTAFGLSTSPGGDMFLPRASYNGEYLLVASDGLTGLRRYADAIPASALSLTPVGVASSGTVTAGSTLAVDAFLPFRWNGSGRAASKPVWPDQYFRVLRNNAGTLTLQDALFSSAATSQTVLAFCLGKAYPAVPVENAGTVTTVGEPTNSVTGVGTRFQSHAHFGYVEAILVMPDSADAFHSPFYLVGSETSATCVGMTVATASPYQLTAPLPFRDVAVYNGSLFGCGVAEQEGRVYVGPDGWNLTLPPGFPAPFDPFSEATSANANDFLMDYIDVPSLTTDDPVVALLETAGGVLVLKRKATHIITGSYPSFSQDMVEQGKGVGAYSVASSISGEMGAFWVDENGIYWSRTGTDITNIAEAGIHREWQNLMRSGIEYISLGVHATFLLVAVKPSSGAGWSYIFDLRYGTWGSRFLNYVPFYQYPYRSSEAGGIDQLLSIRSGGTKIVDAAPMVTGKTVTGTAASKQADDDGSSIDVQVVSGSGLAQAAGIEGEAKLLEVSLSTLHPDASGVSQVTATVVHRDGQLDAGGVKTKSVVFSSDMAGAGIRRRKKPVNRSGREVQVILDLDNPGSAEDFEIHEFVTTWRDLRGRT